MQGWVDYVLAARVMLVRDGENRCTPVDGTMSFAQWSTNGHALGWPDLVDLDYHLSTLFPPVRPRGWFELRTLDALPTPFWHAAVAVTHQLLTDSEAADQAHRAVAGTEDLWVDAAQLGLGHPRLAAAAEALFAVAIDSLERRGGGDALTAVVTDYADRWVARGRSPADDRLDDWRRDGTLIPRRGSPVPYGRDEHARRGNDPR